MKKNVITENRRHFLKKTSAAVALIPASTLIGGKALAAHHAMVDPNSDVAKGLEYVELSEVDNQKCNNCALYSNGNGEKGDCPLFQGAKVGEDAWCSAWVTKG